MDYVKTKFQNTDSKIYIYAAIFFVSFLCIGYAAYTYTTSISDVTLLENSSYYGENIATYEAIFQQTTNTINDCITICNNDMTCDGITYNSDTKTCMGTRGGKIRNENSNYTAWVKPPYLKPNIDTINLKKAIILGYTSTMKIVNSNQIPTPYTVGNFCYSFNLTIYDVNLNYGSWRHIFHKGTPIDPGTTLNYLSWENLIMDFPIQNIGVWMSPFTNNLRIAVTTSSTSNNSYGSYSDAFIQKCDSITGDCYITDMPGGKWVDKSKSGDSSVAKTKIETYVEYFDHDLQNIPLNKQINITINFRGRDVEVYFDGKIIKIYSLDGVPIYETTKSNLYAMNDKTIGGEITNLIFYPDAVKLENMPDILKMKSN